MSVSLERLTYKLMRACRRFGALPALARRWILTPRRVAKIRAIRQAIPAAPRAAADGDDRPVVLILALRPWSVHRGYETLFSRLLMAEGARVVWALCDGLMTGCDAMLDRAPQPDLCAHCVHSNRRMAEAAGVEIVSLRDCLPAGHPSIAHARNEVDVQGSGHPAAARVIVSLQRSLRALQSSGSSLTSEQSALKREFIFSAELMRIAAPALLDRVKPDAVLALNGKFFPEALVLEEAKRRDLAIWGYERGINAETVFLCEGIAIPYPMQQVIESLAVDEISAEQSARVRTLLDGRVQKSALDDADRAVSPWPSTRQGGAGRKVVLFSNVIWDSAVVGEDTIFEDMFAWIQSTIETLSQRADTQVVVRVHPAEDAVYWHPTRDRTADVIRARFPSGLPENVALFASAERVDSYRLMREADLVLVYASTVGMEAAAFGKRVVVAANTHYASAPFVFRPSDRHQYFQLLDDPATEPPSHDSALLAERYLYRLYFESMVRIPAIRAGRSGFELSQQCLSEALLRPVRERLRGMLACIHSNTPA